MRKQYDLMKLAWKRNPYARRLKRPVTIRLDPDVIEHFKKLSRESGMPYQQLINLYLRDCASSGRRLKFRWVDAS